jgi:hypothetical protein
MCLGSSTDPGVETARPHVVDVLRAGADGWRARHVPTPEQARFWRDVVRCRTAALGGHLHVCPACAYEVPVYNSCRNRHCPQCQSLAEARWLAAREAVLLPVGHHHLVFTLPAQLRSLVQQHPRELLGLLCAAVNETLASLASEHIQATVGITLVVHTWSRELRYHPHVHCLVTAGGLSQGQDSWVERTKFLFPVRQMRARFRARFLAGLDRLVERGAIPLTADRWRSRRLLLPRKNWVVYTEAPFGRSTHVLAYLGRYTHRVAITDARIVSADNERVRFRTRGEQVAELSCAEFTDRFLLHILPSQFRKIRHYGLYAPGAAAHSREQARALIGDGDRLPEPPQPPHSDQTTWVELFQNLSHKDPLRCPRCLGAVRMRRVALPLPSASPPSPRARSP